MFNKSKLQNAKQKISKLKEKYFNNSNLTKGDDNVDFLSSTAVLLDNSKLEKDLVLNEASSKCSPVHELKSPRVEITDVFGNTENNINEMISSQIFGKPNNHNLIDDQRQHSNISSNQSLSEHSFCSKITNKTIKTESIVLSDLSNQFENICFLPSSTSDEENTIGRLHLASLTVPQTGRNFNNLSGLPQISTQSLDGNSELKQSNGDVQKGDLSSSELSEVQSDANSTVFSDKKESLKIYLYPKKLEANYSEEDILKKKEEGIYNSSECSKNSSYKTVSDKNQTSISESKSKFSSRSQAQESQGNKFAGSNEKLKINCAFRETKKSQLSSNSPPKQKRINRNSKNAELNYVLQLKHDVTKLKNHENSKRKIKDGEVSYSRYINRSRPTVSDENIQLLGSVHKGDTSLPKKSRHKYPKRSKTISKHSTHFKPSAIRPTLKSCVLIKPDEPNEENKFLSNQRMLRSKLDGYDYEEVISQLLWSQVQLTRHFIHSHHQMYLTCCQAVKLLSEKHNSNNQHVT